MNSTVIYSKKYTKADLEEELNISQSGVSVPVWDFNKFYEKLMQETKNEYVYLPEREVGCKEFIDTAKEVADYYNIDIEIEKYEQMVTVFLSFDESGSMCRLLKLIKMADDIDFFTKINDREITMSLDFYTHSIYRSGQKISPV